MYVKLKSVALTVFNQAINQEIFKVA